MKNILPRSIVKLFLAFLAIGFASSCVNLQKVQLLQEKSIIDYSQEIVNTQQDDYKINAGDHLYIKIYSSDAQTSRYFQTDFPQLMNASYIYLNSYKVDNEGFVNYSFAGKTQVKGMTIEEAQDAVTKSLNEYFKDVKVYLKLVNFNISVLGEVKKPGTYTIDRDQITILQALGLAGGITDFSKANRVMLVRKSTNGSIVKYLDLTNNSILQSEYLYLLPDDVLYVAPRKSKSLTYDKLPYTAILGILSVALSIVALTD